MSKVVWKYQFGMRSDRSVFSMPRGAIIRRAAMQGGKITLWAEVAPDPVDGPHTEYEQRYFIIIPTGIHWYSDLTYIDTVFDGEYVWHIYESKGEPQ